MVKSEKNISIIPKEVLVDKIFFLRNEKIMLDIDLAKLYNVESRRLRTWIELNNLLIELLPLYKFI